MNIKDIKLFREQQKHLKSIEWLIGDNYCSGRSYLLAVAFIKKAIKNPNRWVRVFDHYPHRLSNERMLSIIKTLIGKKLLEKTEFRKSDETFRITS